MTFAILAMLGSASPPVASTVRGLGLQLAGSWLAMRREALQGFAARELLDDGWFIESKC